jgi:hypothetical protein
MSRHWYKPTFWRWWWATSAPTGAKLFAAIVVSAGVVFAGYELTGVFSQASAAQVYTYVQTIRQVRPDRAMQPPVTIRENGRVVTVHPAPLTVMGPVRQELVTITAARDRVVTVDGPASTVDVERIVTNMRTAAVTTTTAVTRTATVARAYTVTVARGQTATAVRPQTVTVQQTAPGQTVSAERTVTQTSPPVTTTVTRATTVPVTVSATTTVERPTTQTVVVTTTTTVPVPTTVIHTVTSTVTQTLPVTVTVKTTT